MDSIAGISYYLNKMLHAIKRVLYDNFVFQQDSTPVHLALHSSTIAVQNSTSFLLSCGPFKAKFHYAILLADRSEAGRRPAASWNLAYHASTS